MKKFNMVYRHTPWLYLVWLSCSLSAVAQTQQEKTNYVLLDGYCKSREYKKAIEPLDWLLKNSPKFHKNVYIKGYKLYHKLAEQASDPQLKKAYQDKALKIYDLRVMHFGEAPKVLNMKGYYAYYYWSQRADKEDELYHLYQKIIELNGDNTYAQCIQNYMYMIFQRYQRMQIEGVRVIEIYDQLTQIIEHNLTKAIEASPQNDPKKADPKKEDPKKDDQEDEKKEWKEIKKYVDDVFTKIVLMRRENEEKPLLDCEFIEKYYLPQYHQNPNDIKLIKKIVRDMLLVRRYNPAADCGRSAVFVELNEKLFYHAPTYKRATLMIKLYKILGNEQKVEEIIYRLPEFAQTKEAKAEANMTVAQYKRKKGRYQEARKLALEAMRLDPGKAAQAYHFIGDLYYSSGKICSHKNPVLARAAYVAAYHMYQKAGNARGMARAKVQCPDLTVAFTYNYKAGQLIEVGCWIGGKVKLITR